MACAKLSSLIAAILQFGLLTAFSNPHLHITSGQENLFLYFKANLKVFSDAVEHTKIRKTPLLAVSTTPLPSKIFRAFTQKPI
jgi:hypothetical protein